MEIYIATRCCYDSDSPCKPGVLGVFKSRADAETAVLRDIDEWCSFVDPDGEGYTSRNFADMSARLDIYDRAGCEWNIERTSIPADWTNE